MMTGPIRSSRARNDGQPPRPPNAWILYRSDKLKSLPPEQPGQQRRAQADVSRLISEMWRVESEAVKLEYERLADAKKAEHQRMHPGYRFQPMKKEEKKRIKEEKRQEKERARAQKNGRVYANAVAGASQELPPMLQTTYAAPYHVPDAMSFPMLDAHMPRPLYAQYDPEVQYGPAGPSPPLSAASFLTSSAHDSPAGTDELFMPPSTCPSTSASAITDAVTRWQHSLQSPCDAPFPTSCFSSLQQQSPQNAYGAESLPPPQQQPQAAHPRWLQNNILPQPCGAGAAGQATEWNDHNSLAQGSVAFKNPQEYLNFDVPLANPDANNDDNNANTSTTSAFNGLAFEDLQATLACIRSTGVHAAHDSQLENTSSADLVAHPQGELDIEMAPQPDLDLHSLDELGLRDLFGGVDFDFDAAYRAACREFALDPGMELEEEPMSTAVAVEPEGSLKLQSQEFGSLLFQACPPPSVPSTSTHVPFMQMTNTAMVPRAGSGAGYVPPGASTAHYSSNSTLHHLADRRFPLH